MTAINSKGQTMLWLLFLLAVLSAGCKAAPIPPNPDIDFISSWTAVDCPRCDGKGQVYIDEKHPLHEAGYPVGWATCDTCDGDKLMLTSGRGAYAKLRR